MKKLKTFQNSLYFIAFEFIPLTDLSPYYDRAFRELIFLVEEQRIDNFIKKFFMTFLEKNDLPLSPA